MIERDLDPAVRPDALAHAESAVARHQLPRRRLAQIVAVVLEPLAHLDDVAMPLGGQQADLRALVLEQRVGRDRGAMHDALGAGEHRRAIEAERLRPAVRGRPSPRATGPPAWRAPWRSSPALAASTDTRSVKVPPTSMPMRSTRSASFVRDEAERAIPARAPLPCAARARPSRRRRRSAACSTSPGRITMPVSLVLIARSARPCRLEPVAVRLAVLAAEHAAGAILDAVAGRVADRRLRRLDHQLEFAARAAAIAPVAAAVGAELVRRKNSGKRTSVHLEAAELDAAGRLPLAGARPAVARRRRAAAGPRLEQVPDEGLLACAGRCPGWRCGSAGPSRPSRAPGTPAPAP